MSVDRYVGKCEARNEAEDVNRRFWYGQVCIFLSVVLYNTSTDVESWHRRSDCLLVLKKAWSPVNVEHWLATGKAFRHKTVYRYQLSLCLITYFYLPSLSSPFSVWGHGGMMLKSMWNVLVFPERMHRSRTNGGWRVKGQLDNLVYFVGWPLNGCGVLCGRIPLMA